MIPWDHFYLPLETDLSYESGITATVTHENGSADFSSRAGWLTTDGVDDVVKIANSAAVEDLFTIGSGAALFLCSINAAAPAGIKTILSAPGGKQGATFGTRGINVSIMQTDGDVRWYVNVDTQFNTMSGDQSVVADGTDHSFGILFDIPNNTTNMFVDREPAYGSKASTEDLYTSIDFALSVSSSPDVLLCARQPNVGGTDPASIDQELACEIRRCLWINFRNNPPNAKKINRMVRQYHDLGGLLGSEFHGA